VKTPPSHQLTRDIKSASVGACSAGAPPSTDGSHYMRARGTPPMPATEGSNRTPKARDYLFQPQIIRDFDATTPTHPLR
jgi:hypothetical protein